VDACAGLRMPPKNVAAGASALPASCCGIMLGCCCDTPEVVSPACSATAACRALATYTVRAAPNHPQTALPYPAHPPHDHHALASCLLHAGDSQCQCHLHCGTAVAVILRLKVQPDHAVRCWICPEANGLEAYPAEDHVQPGHRGASGLPAPLLRPLPYRVLEAHRPYWARLLVTPEPVLEQTGAQSRVERTQ